MAARCLLRFILIAWEFEAAPWQVEKNSINKARIDAQRSLRSTIVTIVSRIDISHFKNVYDYIYTYKSCIKGTAA